MYIFMENQLISIVQMFSLVQKVDARSRGFFCDFIFAFNDPSMLSYSFYLFIYFFFFTQTNIFDLPREMWMIKPQNDIKTFSILDCKKTHRIIDKSLIF